MKKIKIILKHHIIHIDAMISMICFCVWKRQNKQQSINEAVVHSEKKPEYIELVNSILIWHSKITLFA